MNVYMYQAALYCEPCGEAISNRLAKQLPAGATHPIDEREYDSGTFPKGPYPDGGGEADAPQHCDACSVFLENPLTTEGYAYVRERLAEYASGFVGYVQGTARVDSILSTWREFYEIDGGGAV